MATKSPRTIETGTMIFTDFDSTRNIRKPAMRQNMAVRVPEANIAQIESKPTIPKNNLCFLTLFVMAMIQNAAAAAAM